MRSPTKKKPLNVKEGLARSMSLVANLNRNPFSVIPFTFHMEFVFMPGHYKVEFYKSIASEFRERAGPIEVELKYDILDSFLRNIK